MTYINLEIQQDAMEFSTQDYPSHQKGKKTRAEILAAVMETPEITAEMMALFIGKSPRQTGRHLRQLIAEGKIHKSGIGYSIGRKVILFFLIFPLGIF